MARIMIVDDDVTITELMKALVKMDGHEPTTVNDSLQALEVARSLEPDLITLDLMMPDLNGFDLCKLLRNDPQFTETPILVISAKDDPNSKLRALEAGAKDYITKPFGVNDFLFKVNSLVKK